jgi:hypothetical protein
LLKDVARVELTPDERRGITEMREVARELAASGFVNERGKSYAAKSVASMLS